MPPTTSFSTTSNVETTRLGSLVVPRIFNGLWQLASNAWGTAPANKIRDGMAQHVQSGFYAFDMVCVSVYPSILAWYKGTLTRFGLRLTSLSTGRPLWERRTLVLIGATKWCIFRPTEATRELVVEAVRARNTRMKSKKVDLLQIHWQDYSQKEYLTAFRYLTELKNEGLISELGLCNFDSIRTKEICQAVGRGVIVSNQVQFSLIDVRPLYDMAKVCESHGVKLLTYGSLCGGFLANKYLEQLEPDFYDDDMTPSQRKYLDMITSAWGSWALFQSLLRVLRKIGDRHGGVSISNVATRWVLDHAFVAAVLIGTRMGVSEHIEDNHRVFSFKLTEEDKLDINSVLEKSNGRNLIQTIGDCGAEYRQQQ